MVLMVLYCHTYVYGNNVNNFSENILVCVQTHWHRQAVKMYLMIVIPSS